MLYIKFHGGLDDLIISKQGTNMEPITADELANNIHKSIDDTQFGSKIQKIHPQYIAYWGYA